MSEKQKPQPKVKPQEEEDEELLDGSDDDLEDDEMGPF